MYAVSVVVPLYNVEKYLEGCIESIIKQTLKNIEIILVDDGSTDNSLKILKKYQSLDNRIKILYQKNQGAGVARNAGMEVAVGEYLMFLDADDVYEATFVEKMYNKAKANDLDVLVCRSDEFIGDDLLNKRDSDWTIKDNLLPDKDIFSIDEVRSDRFSCFIWWPWDKILKRSFINELNIYYQNTRTTNDLFFISMCVFNANKISVLNDVLIHHRITKTSLSATREKSWYCVIEALDTVAEYMKKLGIYDRYEHDFINYVMEFTEWHINTLREPYKYYLYDSVYKKYHRECELRNKDYFYKNNVYDFANKLSKCSVIDILIEEKKQCLLEIE